MAVARQHPSVPAAMLSTYEALHASIADAVAQRLGMRPGEDVPQMIAGLALTTVRTGMDLWSQDPPDDPDSPVPYVERAASLLRSFFGSEHGDAAENKVSRRTRALRNRSAKPTAR